MPSATNGALSRCACAKVVYVSLSFFSLSTCSLFVISLSRACRSLRKPLAAHHFISPWAKALCVVVIRFPSLRVLTVAKMSMPRRAKRICQMSISRCRIYGTARQSSSGSYSRWRKVASHTPGKRRKSWSRIRRPDRQLSDADFNHCIRFYFHQA